MAMQSTAEAVTNKGCAWSADLQGDILIGKGQPGVELSIELLCIYLQGVCNGWSWPTRQDLVSFLFIPDPELWRRWLRRMQRLCSSRRATGDTANRSRVIHITLTGIPFLSVSCCKASCLQKHQPAPGLRRICSTQAPRAITKVQIQLARLVFCNCQILRFLEIESFLCRAAGCLHVPKVASFQPEVSLLPPARNLARAMLCKPTFMAQFFAWKFSRKSPASCSAGAASGSLAC
mmetsp:Transcript_49151/g.106972  ORF Transcript_49151/g.106972 Transcript_49151/m.106972 type:complete len:234 (-) Transcript_49151:391-1092(-)